MSDDWNEAGAIRSVLAGKSSPLPTTKKQSNGRTRALTPVRSASERYAQAVANGSAAEIDAALAEVRIANAASKTGLELVSLDDFVVRPNITWLVRRLLPAESIVLVFGAAKSGKTHIVADMTMHAAHGMHWHGHTVAQALRVAYLAGEGRNGLRVRLRAWRQHHCAELRGDIRIIPEALPLASRLPDVLAVLRPYRPDVVVVDTLNAYFGTADENSTQDMTAFVTAIRCLRDDLHCGVIVIHHTGLADATRERGSSVLRAAADVIVQVARDKAGTGMIGLQVIEARDMEPWAEPLSLRLQTEQTDWLDDEGQPITTCIVMAGEAPVTLPGRGSRSLGIAQSKLLAVARELAASRRNGSHDVTLARHEVSALAQQRGMSRQSIGSAWKPLHERGLLRLVEPGSITIRCSP